MMATREPRLKPPDPEYRPGPAWKDDVERPAVDETTTRALLQQAERDAARRHQERIEHLQAARPFLVSGAAALGLVGLVLGIWAMWFRTTEIEMAVTETFWSRAINVETFEPVPHSHWGSRPNDSDAYNVEVRSEIHHYDTYSYPCGSDSNGNTRYCTGSTPVYRNKVHYLADRWHVTHEERSWSSSENAGWTEPEWPEPDLGPATDVIGHRRMAATPEQCDTGSRHCRAHYRVTLLGPDFSDTYAFDIESEWSACAVGQPVTALVNSRKNVRGVVVPHGETA